MHSVFYWWCSVLGVRLGEMVPKTTISLVCLVGKSIAIDAYNTLYQFLAIIRLPNGTPLKDRSGRVTSHLSGLLYRNSNLMEVGVKIVYVFDGAPPVLKDAEIKRRSKGKAKARVLYRKALAEGKIEEARTYAQATSRVESYMETDSKHLLTLMGIPWVQAPSEGEAQAAYLTKKGITDFCASQDYDSLLYGAPTLLRNVAISGRRKLPKRPIYVDVVPEIVELQGVTSKLGISYEQLIDIGLLIGTDYNPGVKGIGPKTALKLVKEHGSLDEVLEAVVTDSQQSLELRRIKNMFLHPKVTDDYSLGWNEPQEDSLVRFLCGEHDFAEDRVRKALDKMRRMGDGKAHTTLDTFIR